MKISYQWLGEHIKTESLPSPQAVAKQLTFKTVEVESVTVPGELLEHIVVGKIVSIEKHPNADKLKVCKVEIGKGKLEKGSLQIVCGGTNIREGMKVALGKIGAKVRWHGQGDLVELKATEIRGVKSFGMICAADEIGLGEMFAKKEEKEIIDLSKWKLGIGAPLVQALGLNDIIFDIDNKSLSNRPDLFGHYGIAREISAIFNVPLRPYNPPAIKKGKDLKLSVKVTDKRLCPRYMAVALGGITVGASPLWLQNRLRAAGLRPINNIVDITNYVMYEIGQPLHAFDFQQSAISSDDSVRSPGQQRRDNQQSAIVVRRAKGGEKFVTLDGKERVLSKDMLMITDGEKNLAVAGVIGGAESGVNQSTTSIIFEAANFDALSVRKTAATLGLRTDSSTRFEKSLDPTQTEAALRRAVEMTLMLCPRARVISNIADASYYHLDRGPIVISEDFVSERVGALIPKKTIIKRLRSLGFRVKEKGKKIAVTVPTWRATKDISIAEDLVEEIVRLHGYERISARFPIFSITPPPRNSLHRLERRMKELLAYEFGYTETYNYSFESPEWLARLDEKTETHLELNNPIAKDRPLVREHMIPNLLMNVEANLHRFDRVALFEIGRVFWGKEMGEFADNKKKERLPKQPTLLGLVYAAKGEAQPYFQAAEAMKGVFDRLGVGVTFHKIASSRGACPAPQINPDTKLENKNQKQLWCGIHPHRFAEMRINDKPIGLIGELHPELQERVGIPYRVAMVEVNLNDVVSLLTERARYQPVPKYPDVTRDVAFFIDRDIQHATIAEKIQRADPLIASAELFDVFDGKNLPAGKKSMAYHIVYRSPDRTLTAEEVNLAHGRVVARLEKEFGADIRK